MSERREQRRHPDEPPLDPTEKWGQGRDESHPVPTRDAPDAASVAPLDADAEREVEEERELFGESVPGDPRPPGKVNQKGTERRGRT
jgi:hypothetical protein